MQEPGWPHQFDIWNREDMTWGWVQSSHLEIYHSSILQLDMFLLARGFLHTVENDICIYRPRHPSTVPDVTLAIGIQTSCAPTLDISSMLTRLFN